MFIHIISCYIISIIAMFNIIIIIIIIMTIIIIIITIIIIISSSSSSTQQSPRGPVDEMHVFSEKGVLA